MVKSTSENVPQNSHERNPDRLKKRSGKTAGSKSRTRVQSKHPHSAAVDSRFNAVFLVGFMGAGKTSVGRALGQRLNWLFEDLDDRIARREGKPVAQIFRDSGELEFRRAEHTALRQVLQELRGSGFRVIAMGGGAFVQKKNAMLLKAATAPIVFLDASVEELWQRCCAQASETGTERPLLRSLEQFRHLYETRRKSYSKASVQIQTGKRSVDEIAVEIAEKLGLKKIGIRIERGEVE
jgi:shikimate kinase